MLAYGLVREAHTGIIRILDRQTNLDLPRRPAELQFLFRILPQGAAPHELLRIAALSDTFKRRRLRPIGIVLSESLAWLAVELPGDRALVQVQFSRYFSDRLGVPTPSDLNDASFAEREGASPLHAPFVRFLHIHSEYLNGCCN